MQTPDRPQFIYQLQAKWDQGKFLCVGLDLDTSKLPNQFSIAKDSEDGLHTRQSLAWKFLEPIIDATADIVCAYKPNIAFYEGLDAGRFILQETLSYIRDKYPDIPVIGDFKRADIANTNRGYATAAFEIHQVDAVTTNPYFGSDTYPPFTNYKGKGLISMVKTSNPGSAEIQNLPIDLGSAQESGLLSRENVVEIIDKTGVASIPLYWLVAYRHGKLAAENPNIGIVVGATHPEAFEPVRNLYGDGYVLIPGIGTQGGDLEETLKYSPNKNKQGIIINSSSGILYASKGKDFAEAAANAAKKLDNQIRQGLAI